MAISSAVQSSDFMIRFTNVLGWSIAIFFLFQCIPLFQSWPNTVAQMVMLHWLSIVKRMAYTPYNWKHILRNINLNAKSLRSSWALLAEILRWLTTQWRQGLRNLISNGFDFGGPRHHLILRSSTSICKKISSSIQLHPFNFMSQSVTNRYALSNFWHLLTWWNKKQRRTQI